jgi:hypothetical protein
MELFIIRDGQQTGPFNEDSVQTLLKSGGLRPDDMGWHKGLPAWLPLGEFFQAGSGRTEPPPLNGATSGVRSRPATARQKALLQYVGATISAQATREEAALAICDALENPKLTSRLAKWGEEKLRLHPELFQEEVDYRRANRISRFLELCQTDGAEVVKDITKAHVQVLMESLDKRQVGWDNDSRTALWDYLLPSVAEHFPQLLQEEWKGRLKYGGTSKVAAAYGGMPTTGLLTAAPPAHPSALHAVFRGIIYGGLALGLVLGGIHLFRDTGKSDIARSEGTAPPAPAAANEAKPAAPAPDAAKADAAKTDAAPAPVDAEPVHPTKVALIGATPNEALAAVPPTQPAAAAEKMTPAPSPAPEAAPSAPAAPAPAAPPMTGTAFTPAPAPPGATPNAPQPAVALDAPATPPPAVRDSAVLIQPVTVQLQFGKVTLNPGTKLRLIAVEGANVRVNFNNNIVLVPVASTDVDPANTVVAAAAPGPAVTLPAAPLTPAVPTANVPAPSPTSSLAPKPLPSADL